MKPRRGLIPFMGHAAHVHGERVDHPLPLPLPEAHPLPVAEAEAARWLAINERGTQHIHTYYTTFSAVLHVQLMRPEEVQPKAFPSGSHGAGCGYESLLTHEGPLEMKILYSVSSIPILVWISVGGRVVGYMHARRTCVTNVAEA